MGKGTKDKEKIVEKLINDSSFIDDINNYCDITLKLAKKIKSSNIIGTYAEILACQKFSLKMVSKNTKGIDAFSVQNNDDSYQIKSRWKKDIKNNGQNEFGAVEMDENGDIAFKHLILIYFIEEINNYDIYEISAENLRLLLNINVGFVQKKVVPTKNGNKTRIIIRITDDFIDIAKQGELIKICFKGGSVYEKNI